MECWKIYTFFYKNKVYKNIRLQWQKIKNMLRTYQGFEWERLKKKNFVFALKLWWGISTKYKDCPNLLHGFRHQKKNNEVQFDFLKDMRHARESLHLENKNMLNILGLKLKKKLKSSEGFLHFWCSY